MKELRDIRGFILDLDGTTYVGERLTRGAREFLDLLDRTDHKYVFVTNNSSTSSEVYERKLRRLGLPVADHQVLTSGEATAMYLKRRGYQRLYVVGTPALEAEMLAAGFTLTPDGPDCVVLGYDRTLTYSKVENAARWILRGVPFVATHPDRVCPTEEGYVPDCGAMIALLEAATGVSPLVVGKPEPLLAEMALEKLGLQPHEVAVVGDRLYTDMEMGRRAGAVTVLVLSGETTTAMVEAAPAPPDFVMSDLEALGCALTDGARHELHA